jgi:hypothetical protein
VRERGVEDEEPNRHVHEKDAAPAETVDEDTAEQRRRDRAEPGDRDERANRSFAVGVVMRGRDEDRERERHRDRAADALHEACRDQGTGVGREPARERPGEEDDDPEQVDALTAVEVAECPRGQREPSLHQTVRACDPLLVREPRADRALHRRQREVDNGDVEHRHERREIEAQLCDKPRGRRKRDDGRHWTTFRRRERSPRP